MRALHRIPAGQLPSPPVRAGLFALTRRAASTIRRCRGLQTKQCGQPSDCAKCKTDILRPARGTDVDPCDETSLSILLPTPVRRVIVDSHAARVLSLRRRAAPTPTSYKLTPLYLILCAGALRSYPDADIPYPQSLHHYRNEWWTCAICRSCISARPASRSPSAPSACQASPVSECREKPQTYIGDVISGLHAMSWDIILCHDEETGLDQLTAHPQKPLRPAPNALYGFCWRALRLRLDRHVRRKHPAAVRAALLGLPSSAVCPRWLESLPLLDALDRLDGPIK
ncbi:hypothetical protein ACVIIV_003323 [Bradyrhizobium sp. USDA 4354]